MPKRSTNINVIRIFNLIIIIVLCVPIYLILFLWSDILLISFQCKDMLSCSSYYQYLSSILLIIIIVIIIIQRYAEPGHSRTAPFNWSRRNDKMPGGRRGLVAPQNTFLENIIRRYNSLRKFVSQFVLDFYLINFFSSLYLINQFNVSCQLFFFCLNLINLVIH